MTNFWHMLCQNLGMSRTRLIPLVALAATLVACSSSPSTSTASQPEPAGSAMRGLRYCEVLLLDAGPNGLRAEVFNTYPLNDCPEEIWSSLDAAAIAQDRSVPFALLNGPRFWLMDSVSRVDDGSVIATTFTGTSGSLEMNKYAEVILGTPDRVGLPYSPQSVDRKSRFTFTAGSTIYVLVDPEGNRYVMQSWSQQRDATLSQDDLANLADRLTLPSGWSYVVDTVTSDLVVDSTSTPARVLQDEFLNTYSLTTN